ncbi:FTR1-domain-containing protein [Gonapodya prolifera JEL478]|uniref:FTR1-domain-containing protein n=1 Tax=Gonapodya prolifera (strain JEL478) TaxID=1344416 RepID=A0A139AZQ4_GONPJ|nr:FTR1-domain-containing protein [Gonapodya prolifera JEL478]|eukprot:KXS22221.1 FTR1-domain-containing protein [Gonapodya prolifera JEL478]
MPNLFNAGALFILFREALEAAIVIGVLLNFIDKTVGQHKNLAARLRKQIWLGVGVGLAISLVVGVVFSVVYYVLRQDVFGTFEPIWEGTFKTIACILLTVMGFGMLHAGDLERKWERKMLKAGLAEATKEQMLKEQKERLGTPEGDEEETGLSRNGSVPTVVGSDAVALEKAAPSKSMAKRALGLFSFKKDEATKEAEAKEANRPWALFILSFSVVLREGLESVIFLTGVGQGEPYSLSSSPPVSPPTLPMSSRSSPTSSADRTSTRPCTRRSLTPSLLTTWSLL